MNTLAYQVASLLNYDLTLRNDDKGIVALKLFFHLLWSALIFTYHFRLKVKVYDLDLGEYLHTILKQFQVVTITLDWYITTHLPKPFVWGIG